MATNKKSSQTQVESVRAGEPNMNNVISLKQKKQAENSLNISLGGELTRIVTAIADIEGVDPRILIFLWIAKPINKLWDFGADRPRE
jgi:hypothetical protein